LTGRFRSPDPFLKSDERFIYRRIAADSRKVEFGDNAGGELSLDLLNATGFDLGSIPSAHPKCVTEIERDLKKRRRYWLKEEAEKPLPPCSMSLRVGAGEGKRTPPPIN
jgi:hypothetical protein